MNKVVLGTIGGLALGVASGYFVADKGDESSVRRSLAESAAVNQRAPRFGEGSAASAKGDATEKAKTRVKADLSSILKERNISKKANLLLEYYASLSPDEFSAEARKLTSLSPEDRMLSSNLLFSKWAETSPVQAMEFANKLGPRSMMEKGAVLQTWSSMNPEAAAAYFSENKNIMNGRSAGIIASEWARMNPDAALGWVAQLDGRDKSDALRSVFSSFADLNPEAAAAKAATMTAEEIADGRVYDSIARNWAKKDWAATESWIASLPADQQESARQRAIEGLASVDAAAAVEQVNGLQEGEAKNNAVAAVARAMAMENPAMAAELILKNTTDESGRSSGRAVGEVMGNWVYTDPSAAKEWVNKLPTGNLKDSALISYAMQNPTRNYQETVNMVSGIDNERMREFATGAAVRNWMREDAQAAQSWVDSSNLSERTKRMISGGEGPQMRPQAGPQQRVERGARGEGRRAGGNRGR